MTVLRYLKRGRLNAITGGGLAVSIYGSNDYKNVVAVQDEIRDLRIIGHRIIACSKGYYLTNDLKELFIFTGKLKKHANKIAKMARGMESAARHRLNGQKKLLLKK